MTKRSMAATEAGIESEPDTASNREGDAEGKELVGDEVVNKEKKKKKKKEKQRALISDERKKSAVLTASTTSAQDQFIVNCQLDLGDADLDEGGECRRSPNKSDSHVKAAFGKVGSIERKYCHRCSRLTTKESEAGNQSVAKENEEESGAKLVVGKKKGRAVLSAGTGADPPQQQLIICCQADNCNADLFEAKRYHQKHRVCESHAKAAVALVGGTEQRYCQQCSRFHELAEFDNNKRSCRKRLAHHNERRRKAPSEPETIEDSESLPSVLKVNGNSWRVISDTEDTGNSEVMKITLPKRNPNIKHFQIR